LKPTSKRVPGFFYSANEKTFHIVVRIKDSPGALSYLLEILRPEANIISSLSYSLVDGGAIWSGFVNTLSKTTTERDLRKIIQSSPLVEECEVNGSEAGLLVDSFHSGIEYGPDRLGIIIPLAGISRMFNRLVTVFGSGGETILFEEGSALGQSTGQYINSLLGKGSFDRRIKALVAIYRSIGWGIPTLETEKPDRSYTIKFVDCFECLSHESVRSECGFLRGHIYSTFLALSDKGFSCKEIECRLRGDEVCTFRLERVET